MMSTDQPSINWDLDYASLRREGMRQLERLAGSEWTDFNPHDPGITILEQYCYALSELAYRCDFPLPDLLSRDGKDPYGNLFSPARILSSRPITLADLRTLAIDVPGVKNAWIEKIPEYTPRVYHNRYGDVTFANSQEKLIQLQASRGAEPIGLKGIYRVLLEIFEKNKIQENNDESADIVTNVANRLYAHRPLGMDFEALEVMERQYIQVKAQIEIGSGINPEDVYFAILVKIAAYISPSVRFYTLAQRLAAGKRIDEIFDGPMLDHGFIDTEQLSAMERKTGLRISDLIREIMDVEGVLMVKHLALALKADGPWENWWLQLDEKKSPVFDASSEIRLERQQIAISADYYANAKKRYLDTQEKLIFRPAKQEDSDIVPSAGRDRRIGSYYSAQHHFPEVYGLGERGLPPQADTQRRAQLKQLQAYLLFFDQLLANQFAQLAHIGDLFGFDSDNPETYFAAVIDDPALRLDDVWKNDAESRQARLNQLVKNPAMPDDGKESQKLDWARKNRFLDHLLSRFAEQFVDYAQFHAAAQSMESTARSKQLWLRGYPEFSAGRGTGFNLLSAWTAEFDSDRGNYSGVERRLCLKLGLTPEISGTGAPRFYLVEHVLLRPINADDSQKDLPLLVDARSADPYSLQLSVVFPRTSQPFTDESFRRFVEQTVREETPAHLLIYLLWLDGTAMDSFKTAYVSWVQYQRIWREGSEERTLRQPSSKISDISLSYKLRDARDRLIDLLEIGKTYPFADLPVEYTGLVAWGEEGNITIISSQSGVLYQLLDSEGKELFDKNSNAIVTIEALGTGGNLVLQTPMISKDSGFRIKASKLHIRMYVLSLKEDGKVHVENSHLDSYYELCRKDGTSFDPEIVTTGNGGKLILDPPAGVPDQEFVVKAVKTLSALLFQTIDIKVGLDTSLEAEILVDDLLDSSVTEPDPEEPRIVDYGANPDVAIRNTQAGVDYRLVYVLSEPQEADVVIEDAQTQASIALKYISAGSVSGNSQTVRVQALPIQEDVDIRILATREFEGNEEAQHALLDTILALKVKANTKLQLVVAQHQLDYGSGTTVVVKASQVSATYQLFTRSVRDSEFVRDNQEDSTFSIPGMASLRVANPPLPTTDAMPAGAPNSGTGEDLALPVDSLQEDSLIVVRAVKTHRSRDGQSFIPSSIQLLQAAAILVRPGSDSVFPLRLKSKEGDTPAGTGLKQGTIYQVLSGQPGVFYYFRQADAIEVTLGLPVYFHKNGKGLEQLQVEIDFALTGSLPAPPPEWDCPVDSDAEAKLSIKAVKAQTGLELVFEQKVAGLLEAS